MNPRRSLTARLLLLAPILAACGRESTDPLPPARELHAGSQVFMGAVALSPDGSMVAFGETISGRAAVMVAPVDGSSPPVRITHGVWDTNPMWSPDGAWVAYNSEETNGVWIVPAAGGEARPLSPGLPSWDIPTGWLSDGSGVIYQAVGGAVPRPMVAPTDGGSVRPLLPREEGTHGAMLSPDGRQVLVQRYSGGRSTLWVGLFPDGDMRQLTTEEMETVKAGAWSPDGRMILYESRRTGTSDLWVAEVETGELRQLTTDVRDDQDGTWSPDGRWIAFQSNRGGQWDTWVMPATGGESIRVTADLATESSSVWSPSGASLLHVSSLGTARMMQLSIEDGASRELFGWTGHSILDPQASPDGRTIAFVSDRSGSPGIWVVPSAGGEPRPVSAGSTTEGYPRWSPDGRQLAFTSSRTGQPSVWITSDTGTTQRRLVDWDAHTDEHAWSPDGTRIVLHSARDARNFDLWVVPTEGGEATRLTSGLFAVAPQWSPDGNTIFYTARQPGGGSQAQRIPATGGVPTGLGPVAQVEGHKLSPDGQHLAYGLIGGGWAFLEVVPTTGGAPRRLTVEAEQVYHSLLAWSPDGSQLLVSAFDFETSGSNLFTVTWPEGTWRQLTTGEGSKFNARWLPEGQGLVYAHTTSMGSLRVIDLTGTLREE